MFSSPKLQISSFEDAEKFLKHLEKYPRQVETCWGTKQNRLLAFAKPPFEFFSCFSFKILGNYSNLNDLCSKTLDLERLETSDGKMEGGSVSAVKS